MHLIKEKQSKGNYEAKNYFYNSNLAVLTVTYIIYIIATNMMLTNAIASTYSNN